jgi:hypothetical protein
MTHIVTKNEAHEFLASRETALRWIASNGLRPTALERKEWEAIKGYTEDNADDIVCDHYASIYGAWTFADEDGRTIYH